MKQPVKKNNTSSAAKSKTKKPKTVSKGGYYGKRRKSNDKNTNKYGTSKLERAFATEFLDKLGLVYIYQYEAKDIKRFFDFAVTAYTEKPYIMEEKDGIECVKQENQYFPLTLLIEVDGDYYHTNPKLFEASKMNPMQKHNKFVDKLKDDWASMHCVPLLRIWENDIKTNPKGVIDEILKYVAIGEKKKIKSDSKKKPH